jgi:hypothetical protein
MIFSFVVVRWQVGTPFHAYDSISMRTNETAIFAASLRSFARCGVAACDLLRSPASFAEKQVPEAEPCK